VLVHRDLRWYLAGNICSNLGTWLQNTAQILLAYHLTRSVVGVGLVTGAQFVSPLVLGPWAGAFADRFDRRRLLVTTHVASAVISIGMAGFQFGGRLTLVPLVIGALAIGTAFTFTLPALSAFIPTLVPEEQTRPAMALNAVSFNVGRALAPVLGVGVITTVGFAWAFVLNAISFVALAVVFLMLRSPKTKRDSQPPRLLDGLRIAFRERRILALLMIVALVTITTDPPLVLGPSVAREVFHVPEIRAAYFLAAFGAGTVVASLLPSRGPSLRGSATYLFLLGAAITFFAFTTNIWLAIVAVGVAGAASLLVGTAAQTLLLKLSGPQRAGRVMAVWAVAFAGSRPVATAIDTWLAGTVSARLSSFLLALPALVVAGVILILRTSKRGHEWGHRVLESIPASTRP
jgi:MFS family permease